MRCYVNKVLTDNQVVSDVKTLIPEAGVRRRMSRIIRAAVSTACETVGGPTEIGRLDAIITATGLGFLTDSERFLRNMITDDERLLNPTPFIQSTFNTIGGQLALLQKNHCYNVTYVNRSRGFADALLDASMQLADGKSKTVLIGVFEEQTTSQYRIMQRMGFWRKGEGPEGAVFTLLASEPSEKSIAEIVCLDFLPAPITKEDCLATYSESKEAILMTPASDDLGLFPLIPALAFAEAVRKIENGSREVILYDEQRGGRPIITVLRCLGC